MADKDLPDDVPDGPWLCPQYFRIFHKTVFHPRVVFTDELIDCSELITYREARITGERIIQACRAPDATDASVIKAIKKAIEAEAITPEVILYLLKTAFSDPVSGSRKGATSARAKGAVWRKAAIEQWHERKSEFKSLAAFCEDIVNTTLTTMDGQAETAPKFRTVYDFMRKAKKDGKLGA